MATTTNYFARLKPGDSSGCSMSVEGAQTLGLPCVAFLRQSEMEQLGHELVTVWEIAVAGSGFTCQPHCQNLIEVLNVMLLTYLRKSTWTQIPKNKMLIRVSKYLIMLFFA